jgi:serine protease Do
MRGDVILEFNGKDVKSVGSLRNMVAQSKVGSQVKLKILRNGKESELSVLIAELPKEAAGTPTEPSSEGAYKNAFSDITVMDLSKEIARQLGIGSGEKGVVVVKVEPGSAADEAGLKKGDVIQEIDRKRVAGIVDFKKITSSIDPGDTTLLFVNRGGKGFYITIKGS